jgi:Recombinase/Recombinase zinc beta ribbon domain
MRRIVFYLFFLRRACQIVFFLIQRNRDKRSTRKFSVGVFTQPGSRAVRRLLACSIRFAQRVWGGEKAGTIIWCDYDRTRVLNVLTNPAYAGAYAYGRRRCRQAPDGHVERRKLQPDAWAVIIPDRFTGYVSWTDFEAIQTQLRSNAQSFGRPNAFGPPREGPALVQGRVMCGRCGSPMYVRYGSIQRHRPRARYVCVDQADARRAACQSVPATDVDAAVARLVLELMTPMAIEMTLAIQGELDRRVAQSEQHHQLRITRARYESDFARRRFMLVDPANRLVAAGLEAEWNARLDWWRPRKSSHASMPRPSSN